jgi:hypothetical protein
MKKTKTEPAASTKVQWRNRYRELVTFRRISPTAWLFDCDTDGHWRYGTTFVDPSGGPFVAVGMVLSDLHPELPDEKIVSVGHGVYDTDRSGYEYTGILVHTA